MDNIKFVSSPSCFKSPLRGTQCVRGSLAHTGRPEPRCCCAALPFHVASGSSPGVFRQRLSQTMGGCLLLPLSVSLPKCVGTALEHPETDLRALPDLSTEMAFWVPAQPPCHHPVPMGRWQVVGRQWFYQAGRYMPFLQNSSNRNHTSSLPLFHSAFFGFMF